MLSIGKFAKSLGVSIQTLRNWDKEGKLKPTYVTENGYRYYSEDLLNKFRNIKNVNKIKKKNILYARVSTKNQKDELNRQIDNLKQYAYSKGYSFEIITDIGSGLNYQRKGFNSILYSDKKQKILISYKDRFVRFGFDWFDKFLKSKGSEIEIVNNEDLSPQKEMVQDLISIIDIFSCHIYGLRKYKKQIKEDKDV